MTYFIETESVLGRNPCQKQGNNIPPGLYKRGYLDGSSHPYPYTILPSLISYPLFCFLPSQASFQTHQTHTFL